MSLSKEKTRLKVAILPSNGIGDALIFLQAVKGFKDHGYDVSIYHDSIKTLETKLSYLKIYPRKNLLKDYLSFDLIYTQYDDSKETKELIFLRKNHPSFYVFYPTHKKEKHGPLNTKDFASNPEKSMIENLKKSLNHFFSLSTDHDKILDLNYKNHRIKTKRVVIHAFSTEPKRMWPLKKYLALAYKLKKLGLSPYFIMSPEEQKKFSHPVSTKSFNSLADLSEFIHESGFFIGNESGPSHMASLLNIPSIVIAQDHKRMKLWKPDFYPVHVITPPSWIPNFKGLRLRQDHWEWFISTNTILAQFKKLT